MFLTVTFTDKNNTVRNQSINLAQIVSVGMCEGKKWDEGFRSVLYSGNGHAFYSTMEPDEVVLAYQGVLAPEEDVKTRIRNAMAQKDADDAKASTH